MQIDISFPPGFSARGTKRQSRGRWRGGNLVRYFEGDIRPVGGWYPYSKTTVSGRARGLTAWLDNAGLQWCGIGTESGLHVMTRAGDVTEITPAGFAAGQVSQTTGGGFGSGDFGDGAFGAPNYDDSAILPATTWSFGHFGEDLIACSSTDQTLYRWTPNANPAPGQVAALANAPDARAVVVTNERAVMAIGADGDPRLIAWSDVENATDWTASASNRAGDLVVRTQGRLIVGLRHPDGVLLFSESDVWLATYQGQVGYGVRSVTDGAGAVSPNAAVLVDSDVLWMGPESFWSYSGFARPLPCEVSEAVFGNINRAQLSLVHGFHNSSFGEVWWFYPSSDSEECDRYVAYSYKEGHWVTGELGRLAAFDLSPFASVLMSGDDGVIYAHEEGQAKDGVSPYLVGGPLSLGETVGTVDAYIPDGQTVGDADLSITARFYPHGDERTVGPIDASSKTDMRVTGREIDLRFDFASDEDWRLGVPMLRLTPRGRR